MILDRFRLLVAAGASAVLVVGVQVASAATTDPSLALSYLRTDVVGVSASHFPASADVSFTASTDDGGGAQSTVKATSGGSAALAFGLPVDFSGIVTVKAASGDTTKTETIKVGQVLTSTTLRPKTTTTVAPTLTAPTTSTVAPTTTAAPTSNNAGKFTLAVIPDTQNYVGSGDTRFANLTQYLIDNKTKMNLAFATHEGDVMNWPSVDINQAVIASNAMNSLTKAGIKWNATIGNHDTMATCKGGSACPGVNVHDAQRDTSIFNKYFTEENMGSVGGEFEQGKVDNSYSTFTAGGAKWMVVTLELWPRAAAVKWAGEQVAAHPDYNVIIVTHHYLNGDGTIGQSNGGYGDNSPQYISDNLVKKYANIKFVFSGHVDTEAVKIETGVNGNKVYDFLLDMQTSGEKTNPVRFVEIDPANSSFSTRVYSPVNNKSWPQYDRSYGGVNFIK